MKQSLRLSHVSWVLLAISFLPVFGIGERYVGWGILLAATIVACTSEIIKAIETVADDLFEDESVPSHGEVGEQ